MDANAPNSIDPYAAPRAQTDRSELPELAPRTRFVRALLWGSAAISLMEIALGVLQFLDVLHLRTRPGGSGAWLTLPIGCLSVLFHAVLIAAFCLWIHAATARAGAGVDDVRFTPAASVAWWFVPIANLWLPFLVVHHLWQLSAAGADWRKVQPPGKVAAWWLVGIAWVLLSVAMWVFAFRGPDPAVSLVFTLSVNLLSIADAVLAVRLVEGIAGMQRTRLGID